VLLRFEQQANSMNSEYLNIRVVTQAQAQATITFHGKFTPWSWGNLFEKNTAVQRFDAATLRKLFRDPAPGAASEATQHTRERSAHQP
jgi:hypothetical protein